MEDTRVKSDVLITVLVQKGPDEVFRVLTSVQGESVDVPSFRLKPLESVVIQAQEFISSFLIANAKPTEFTYISDFIAPLGSSPNSESSQLALFFAPQKMLSIKGESLQWQTFPDFLRSMPKNKGRILFMKAWQNLLGVDKENIKALEKDDLKPLN